MREKIVIELERAKATYWGTLTVAEDYSEDDILPLLTAWMKEFLKKLRLGRVRSRPYRLDTLGRPVRDKHGYPIFGDPLPGVNIRGFKREKYQALGFIKGDPRLRYSWVLEKGSRGSQKWHIHFLLHISDTEGVPPGAIPEAWPHGHVKVTTVKTSSDDHAKVSRYLAKYLVKQRGQVRSPDFTRSKYVRASPSYGKDQ